jgi:type IV pilus assembly protein PilM
MTTFSDITNRIRGEIQQRMPALHPTYPPIALEVGDRELTLVRLRHKRGGKPSLEAHESRPMPAVGDDEPISLSRPGFGPVSEISVLVQEMFTKSGTKPGKISLVLPDNVAKISLLSLPERPPTRKQMDELLRFKLRRSVPFRMDDTLISYQVTAGEGKEVNILVALMHRQVVEQFESVVRIAGARPGLVDLCTPNLLNLCRSQLEELNRDGNDAALLNCAGSYFSLVVVRSGRIIFFRSKNISSPCEEGAGSSALTRELNHSLAYYQDKLNGEGIHTLLVRTAAGGDTLLPVLQTLGFGSVRTIDPSVFVEINSGLRISPLDAQRMAPAISAAIGRGW